MRLRGQGILNSGLIFFPEMKHLLFGGVDFLMEKKQLNLNNMPLCANTAVSLCMTIRNLARKHFYIDVNYLSCKATFSKTQSQRMWLSLRSVVRRRSLSPSCCWALEITGCLVEVIAPCVQSIFQIQINFHSTRESHFFDLLALSMLNVKRITANNGGVELEIIFDDKKYKTTQI